MEIVKSAIHLRSTPENSVLTIGNFDGVHRGHRALIERTVTRAQQSGMPSVIVTFDPHPQAFFRSEEAFQLLFEQKDQAEQLALLGIDLLVIEPLHELFQNLPHQSSAIPGSLLI